MQQVVYVERHPFLGIDRGVQADEGPCPLPHLENGMKAVPVSHQIIDTDEATAKKLNDLCKYGEINLFIQKFSEKLELGGSGFMSNP